MPCSLSCPPWRMIDFAAVPWILWGMLWSAYPFDVSINSKQVMNLWDTRLTSLIMYRVILALWIAQAKPYMMRIKTATFLSPHRGAMFFFSQHLCLTSSLITAPLQNLSSILTMPEGAGAPAAPNIPGLGAGGALPGIPGVPIGWSPMQCNIYS